VNPFYPTLRCERFGFGRVALVATLVAGVLEVGCRSKTEASRGAPPAPAKSAKPVDRLAPGELAPGTGQVFGLVVPRGMKVKGAFTEVAYLEGAVEPEALSNYVRERVDIERVEIGAARTLFPNARIRGGAPDKVYEIEVVWGGAHATRLVVRDVTPRGVNAPPNLSDAERWRQAGRTPDGKPLDMNQLR
jgi:hypothetical protein